jgi:hypothetical protein
MGFFFFIKIFVYLLFEVCTQNSLINYYHIQPKLISDYVDLYFYGFSEMNPFSSSGFADENSNSNFPKTNNVLNLKFKSIIPKYRTFNLNTSSSSVLTPPKVAGIILDPLKECLFTIFNKLSYRQNETIQEKKMRESINFHPLFPAYHLFLTYSVQYEQELLSKNSSNKNSFPLSEYPLALSFGINESNPIFQLIPKICLII